MRKHARSEWMCSPDSETRARRLSIGHSVLVAALLLASAQVHAGGLDHSREAATLVATNSGAVKRQDAAAMYVLGNMFSGGVGVSRDDTAAFRWYMRAARRGNADAMNAVGIAYATGRGVSHADLVQARRWFARAADDGCVAAMNNIALAHYQGQGGAVDYAQAARWYERAATRGDASAMNALATLYSDGKGLGEDHGKAFALFSQSANLGYGLAMMNLGLAYARGDTVKADNVTAFAWLGRALMAGLPDESRAAAERAMGALAQHMSADQLLQGRRLIDNGLMAPDKRSPPSEPSKSIPTGVLLDGRRREKTELLANARAGMVIVCTDRPKPRCDDAVSQRLGADRQQTT